MIKQFADNKSIIVLLIPLFVLIHLILGHYLFPFQSVTLGQENLWGLNFNALPLFSSSLLAGIFICLNAVLLNYVFNTFDFFDRLNYLPSFFYVLLVFLFPISFHFCEDLMAHTFFILSLYQLLRIQQNEDARNLSFLAGLFLGISVTFLPEYIVLLLALYFTIFTIRPFVFREFLLPLLGIAFPLLWVYIVNPAFLSNFLSGSSFLAYTPSEQLEIALAALVVACLTIYSYRQLLLRMSKNSIRHKKTINIISFAFFCAFGVMVFFFLFFKTYFYCTILLAILPFILPFSYLHNKAKWLPETLIYLLIIINLMKFLY